MDCKTVILGNYGSGKSTFINYIINNEYKHNISTTIGAEFQMYKTNKNRYLIWDLSGNDAYFDIIKIYLRDVALIMCVIEFNNDITVMENDIHKWIQFVDKYTNKKGLNYEPFFYKIYL